MTSAALICSDFMFATMLPYMTLTELFALASTNRAMYTYLHSQEDCSGELYDRFMWKVVNGKLRRLHQTWSKHVLHLDVLHEASTRSDVETIRSQVIPANRKWKCKSVCWRDLGLPFIGRAYDLNQGMHSLMATPINWTCVQTLNLHFARLHLLVQYMEILPTLFKRLKNDSLLSLTNLQVNSADVLLHTELAEDRTRRYGYEALLFAIRLLADVVRDGAELETLDMPNGAFFHARELLALSVDASHHSRFGNRGYAPKMDVRSIGRRLKP